MLSSLTMSGYSTNSNCLFRADNGRNEKVMIDELRKKLNSDDVIVPPHVRVKGHWKVLCHPMFGVIAIAVKQLFNMIV